MKCILEQPLAELYSQKNQKISFCIYLQIFFYEAAYFYQTDPVNKCRKINFWFLCVHVIWLHICIKSLNNNISLHVQLRLNALCKPHLHIIYWPIHHHTAFVGITEKWDSAPFGMISPISLYITAYNAFKLSRPTVCLISYVCIIMSSLVLK